MIFDRKEHKDIVIKLIEDTNFQGKILELALELKQAVIKARIEMPNAKSDVQES